MSAYDDYWYYQPAKPKAVKGGIKSQRSTRAFAQKWWGRRWIEVLERYHVGARLGRGRSYARSGQVMDLDITRGRITAKVQGTRSTPYAVTIDLKAFSSKDWDRIVERLAEEPVFAAQLLRNEMPEELEGLFQSMRLPLFPAQQGDLKTDCSCPDWSNPCKHIAAVYYLIAEAFDDVPFLLFRLRGMEMDDLMTRLRGTGSDDEGAVDFEEEPVELPLSLDAFWRRGEPPTLVDDASLPPAEHAQLPRRLGSIPFWRSDTPFLQAMPGIYATTSGEAVEFLMRANQEGEGAIEEDVQSHL